MTQAEFTQKCRDFIEVTSANTAQRLYGLMLPEFVDCDVEEQSLTVAYPVQSWEMNAGGAMHGGITTSMIDSVMGSINHVLCGVLTPTIQLNVSFLRGGPSEGRIIVKVKTVKLGRSIIYDVGEAWDEAHPDKLIATAEGTFRNFAG